MVRQFEFPEGATPIADCSGLIPVWVHNLNDLNRVEAENIAIAQRKYLQTPIRDPKMSTFPLAHSFESKIKHDKNTSKRLRAQITAIMIHWSVL